MPEYSTHSSLLSKYSNVLVVGLGKSGYSVTEYLSSRGKDCAVMDSRDEPPMSTQLAQNYPLINTEYGEFDVCLKQSYDLIVVSPGVSLQTPFIQHAKKQGTRIIGDVELFLDENTKPVIAITGTNGKSTVTSLVGCMAKKTGLLPLVAGNIGKPVLQALTHCEQYDIAVLELSSFQLESVSNLGAEAVTILNLTSDHLDRYASEGDYLLAKLRILRSAKRAILPKHDEFISQVSVSGEKLSFGLEEPESEHDFGIKRVSNRRYLIKGGEPLMKLAEVPMIGLHNIKNVLAAFALLDFLSLDKSLLVEAVKQFQSLPHRMQLVMQRNNIKWVNDSKATNLGSALAALRSIEEKIIWIAGGQAKGANFNQLNSDMPSNVKFVILLGEASQQIAQALPKAVSCQIVNSLQEAVHLAHEISESLDTILFSPACASFDMFNNFEHRGDCFTQHVQKAFNEIQL